MSDQIKYSPAQILEATAAIEANRASFQDGSERVEAAYRRLEASSEGTAITSAIDAQTQARALRDQTNTNTAAVKAEAERSLERVQGDDNRFASILGG